MLSFCGYNTSEFVSTNFKNRQTKGENAMRKKTWHRIASAVIAGVMAAQCAAPVLTYADDDTSSTISTATENPDAQVNPGEAVDVTDNGTSNDTAAASDASSTDDDTQASDSSNPAESETTSEADSTASDADSADSVDSDSEDTVSDSKETGEQQDTSSATDDTNAAEEATPHESVTLTINRNGGKFEDLWLDTANEDTLAAHADGDEATLTALGLDSGTNSGLSYEDSDDTLTVHVSDKGSIVVPDALSLDENAHFVRWDVSGGSYNEDTDTLTFEDGVDAYSLTAVYESNEDVDADLIDNADVYNSASEDNGVATLSLDPIEIPNYTQLDLVIEGLEFTSKHIQLSGVQYEIQQGLVRNVKDFDLAAKPHELAQVVTVTQNFYVVRLTASGIIGLIAHDNIRDNQTLAVNDNVWMEIVRVDEKSNRVLGNGIKIG